MDKNEWEKLFGLEGQIAVVTDSGGNASPEVSLLLARAGATLVVVDCDADRVHQLVKNIEASGAKALGITADVELEDEVIALFDRVAREVGSPDILVNCAAVNANEALTEFPLALWDQVQSRNLRSVFLCMREAIRHMVAAGRGGRVVNVTTMGARHPVLHGNGAYSASRAGVTGLTRSAALDYASHGIRVNEILPGAIPGKVQFHESTQKALAAGRQLTGPGMDAERRLLLGYGKPGDIAAGVLYLVGPSGGYLTGQAIVLDGGFLVT